MISVFYVFCIFQHWEGQRVEFSCRRRFDLFTVTFLSFIGTDHTHHLIVIIQLWIIMHSICKSMKRGGSITKRMRRRKCPRKEKKIGISFSAKKRGNFNQKLIDQGRISDSLLEEESSKCHSRPVDHHHNNIISPIGQKSNVNDEK